MSAPQPRTILVPVDFSDTSLAALSLAEDLAKKTGAEIALLHVVHVPVTAFAEAPAAMVAQLLESAATSGRKQLDALAARRQIGKTVLRRGEAAPVILEIVDEMKPWLVVMGTHGRRGVMRLLLGSVAERVLRECPVPVLTVRSPEGASTETTGP